MQTVQHLTSLELAQALEANERRVHGWKALIDAYAHEFGNDPEATDTQRTKLAALIRALNAVEELVAGRELEIGKSTNIN